MFKCLLSLQNRVSQCINNMMYEIYTIYIYTRVRVCILLLRTINFNGCNNVIIAILMLIKQQRKLFYII